MARAFLWFILLTVLVEGRKVQRQQQPLTVVAFYNDKDGLYHDIAFKYGIQNRRNDSSQRHFLQFETDLVPTQPFDSFRVGCTACSLTTKGVAAFFGPTTSATVGIVRSISDNLQIPHFVTTWDPWSPPSNYTFNLYPAADLLQQALADVIRQMHWRSFTILYETDDALIRLQGVLQSRGRDDNPITVRQLNPEKDLRPLMKEIKKSAETRIIVDSDVSNILTILRAAAAVDMMDVYCSYFLTSLDAHTINFSEFENYGSNITTLRLLDPNSNYVQNTVLKWVDEEKANYTYLNLTPNNLKTETALIYDAAVLFSNAMRSLYNSYEVKTEPLECSGSDTWSYGEYVRNKTLKGHFTGLTGDVMLDDKGRRIIFSLSLLEYDYSQGGFSKIGSWDPRNGFVTARTRNEMDLRISDGMVRKLIVVTSRIGEPYLMHKDLSNQKSEGTLDVFEGFSIDLIDEIAQDLNFSYIFKLVPDSEYGSRDAKTGEWNGLLGELLNRRADMAICDLTITYEREKAVDFTLPFMNLGISILYKKAPKAQTNLFSFLAPFSFDVWIYMATAYLGVSVLLFVLSRATPYEWDNPHPCNPDPEELENNFTMVNCLWFSMGSLMGQGCDILPKATPYEWKTQRPRDPNPKELVNTFTLLNSLRFVVGSLLRGGCEFLPKITPYEWNSKHPCQAQPLELKNNLTMNNSIWHNCGSLMQQGSDIAPQAVSTRMVAGMWWFFTLIMISSYTANLAAFLTVAKMDAEIKGVEDLAKQTKIKYGTYKSGSTARFFQTSNVSLYQRVWTVMTQTRPDVFTKGNQEGVERVKKGKGDYAFFMESTSIEYQMQRDCDLVKVGGELDSKGYGIAMPPESPFRPAVNGAILKLQEGGKLKMLKKRWWQEKGGGACNADQSDEKEVNSNELGLSNVGGVFLVLFFGCAAAFLVSILEFLWNCRKIAVEEKITPWEAMVAELKFAMHCSADTKPVNRKQPDETEGGSFLQLQLNYDKYDVEPK